MAANNVKLKYNHTKLQKDDSVELQIMITGEIHTYNISFKKLCRACGAILQMEEDYGKHDKIIGSYDFILQEREE